MKKITTISIIALAVCGAAFGQAPAKKAAATPKSIDCAVMPGHKVDIAKATATHKYADYKGKRYFFCCGGCPGEFKANPAKYAKGPSIPTPKTPAKKA